MKKEIVVNAGFGETRAAIREDGRLVELFLERESHQLVVGNIYKGRVENVLPGMQAAFVNIGLDRNAFLYVDDALEHHNGSDGGVGRGAGQVHQGRAQRRRRNRRPGDQRPHRDERGAGRHPA